MKRSGLVMALILMAVSVSAAETGMGVKAGVSFSRQDVTYDSPLEIDFDRHNGFEIIIFKEQPMTPTFRYTLGVGYAERGISDQVNIVDQISPDKIIGTKEIDGFIKYITVPFMFEVVLPAGGIKPYLAAGPRMMVKIGTTYDPEMKEFFGDVKDIVFGASFAFGAEIPVAPQVNLFAEIAYSPDISYAIEIESFRAKSSAVTIFGGFRF